MLVDDWASLAEAMTTALAVGTNLQVMQPFVPRTADACDVGVNLLGDEPTARYAGSMPKVSVGDE